MSPSASPLRALSQIAVPWGLGGEPPLVFRVACFGGLSFKCVSENWDARVGFERLAAQGEAPGFEFSPGCGSPRTPRWGADGQAVPGPVLPASVAWCVAQPAVRFL